MIKLRTNKILFFFIYCFAQYAYSQENAFQEIEDNMSELVYMVQNRDIQGLKRSFKSIDFSKMQQIQGKEDCDDFQFALLKMAVFSLFDFSADYDEENAVLIFKFLLDHNFDINYIGNQIMYAQIGSCLPLSTGNILHFALTQYIDFFVFALETQKIENPNIFQDQETLDYLDKIESCLLQMVQELLNRGINLASQGAFYDPIMQQKMNVTVFEYLDYVYEFIRSADNENVFYVAFGLFANKTTLNKDQFAAYKNRLLVKFNQVNIFF